MEVVLKKMGNSTALILPPPVLRDLGMTLEEQEEARKKLAHHLRFAPLMLGA